MNRREQQEQQALIQWADMTPMPKPFRGPKAQKIGDCLMHIPNGGWRSRTEAAILKSMGVRPGVLDLQFTVPAGGYHGLWIEMKAPGKGSDTSTNQDDWIERLLAMGYSVGVFEEWSPAARRILNYLGEG